MPTALPTGLLIYNCTKHELYFWIEGAGIITVPFDQAINARPVYTVVRTEPLYNLKTIGEKGTKYGWGLVRQIKEAYPGVILVGSIASARAYPGEIYGIMTLRHHQKYGETHPPLCSPTDFIVFPKENISHAVSEKGNTNQVRW